MKKLKKRNTMINNSIETYAIDYGKCTTSVCHVYQCTQTLNPYPKASWAQAVAYYRYK